jgi:hypothetical protein
MKVYIVFDIWDRVIAVYKDEEKAQSHSNALWYEEANIYSHVEEWEVRE